MRYLCLTFLNEQEMAELPHVDAPHATIEVWPTRELVVDESPG
jgi:hypothetical protein